MVHRWFWLLCLFSLGFLLAPCMSRAEDTLADGFACPPEHTRPWCYWYWISDNVSREGITRDFEAMQRVGIGEVLLGHIFHPEVPAGDVKLFSPTWWELLQHALREGGRLGINVSMFNCPGWSQSGGPWIRPEQAMRRLAWSETRVAGPRRFAQPLAVPQEPFQDVAVLAFLAPQHDADGLAERIERVACTPAVADPRTLVDGRIDTVCAFPDGAPLTIELELNDVLPVRSLRLIPGDTPWSADVELQAVQADGVYETVTRLRCDWSNLMTAVGFAKQAPASASFPPVAAPRFRLLLTNVLPGHRDFRPSRGAALAEIQLSAAARVESFIEKQLGKMHPTPLPLWDAYLWREQPEPDDHALTVAHAAVQDLTSHLAADGTLTWEVPDGEWIIQRFGLTPTGIMNSPASPEGTGLEVDKLNRTLAHEHFEAFIGDILRRTPASDRRTLTRVVADSYEMGAQNWTDDFDRAFAQRYGYDPKLWLPVLSGRFVESADQSDRFLWDLRRLVADRVATQYVGGLRDACHAHGLRLWLENYGHWGFPAEFLSYGGAADDVGGEYWVTGELGSIECRAASSCANIYGKSFASAEAFTGGAPFQNAPAAFKARGDWSFCEGINQLVLTLYIHQPWDDRKPGVNAAYGSEINRHNTWFEYGRTWIEYLRRCCWLLQQGTRVADVAYYIGDDAPKMTGIRQPALPPGRDFDYINGEVICSRLEVRDGLLTLPHGTTYRLLVLPELRTMRPEVLRKIRDLVAAGATVVGPPPSRSPSREGFPDCDVEVRQLAEQLWGPLSNMHGRASDSNGEERHTTRQSEAAAEPYDVSGITPGLPPKGTREFGKGRVLWGQDLDEVFATRGVPPDVEFRNSSAAAKFLHTHRATPTVDIYFISNQHAQAEGARCVFRVAGRQPELWDAVNGQRRDLTAWSVVDGRTIVPLEFAPHQSWFVVFRRPAAPPASTRPNFPAWEPLVELRGPWEVRFAAGSGAPDRVTWDGLADWAQQTDPAIRHYSGQATYRTDFELPPRDDPAAEEARALLDLGEVRDVAAIRLNGRDLGTLWTAPWRVDITDVAQPGSNVLEIDIVNVWNNRLVGDAALPVAQRGTTLLLPTVTAETPLLPAGLLGPVRILATQPAPQTLH